MITTLGCLIMYLIIIVQAKDGALVHFKSEFPVIELEIQVLVKLAEEIAKSDIPVGSRRINGRYIQSHLFSDHQGPIPY
ncbi:hypothetical protein K7X08_013457 [Anisodus acutangulus]|uniref:Uncharacterized protein n=1 Tax=Anisodus acutangulus TaxID=402998 RepID=A0A9Q1LK59_9SOLA|nr:hypothetical protein K7X08_013457 [Anisodus acutangulus]